MAYHHGRRVVDLWAGEGLDGDSLTSLRQRPSGTGPGSDLVGGMAYAYTRRRFAFPSGVGASPEDGPLAEAVLTAATAQVSG